MNDPSGEWLFLFRCWHLRHHPQSTDLSFYWWEATERLSRFFEVRPRSTVNVRTSCKKETGVRVSFLSLLIVSVLGNERGRDKNIIHVLSNPRRVPASRIWKHDFIEALQGHSPKSIEVKNCGSTSERSTADGALEISRMLEFVKILPFFLRSIPLSSSFGTARH